MNIGDTVHVENSCVFSVNLYHWTFFSFLMLLLLLSWHLLYSLSASFQFCVSPLLSSFCLLPFLSVSLSLWFLVPRSLSLPSSLILSRPEGKGLSWGPLAVGACQRVLALTAGPQAPSENPGWGHHCLFIMGTQKEEGQTQGGRWGSEKNGESEKGVQSRNLMAGE